MMRNKLFVNISRCIGCYACEVACRRENKVSPEELRIKVVTTKPLKINENLCLYSFPIITDKCTGCIHLVDKNLDPACVAICPTKALKCFTS